MPSLPPTSQTGCTTKRCFSRTKLSLVRNAQWTPLRAWSRASWCLPCVQPTAAGTEDLTSSDPCTIHIRLRVLSQHLRMLHTVFHCKSVLLVAGLHSEQLAAVDFLVLSEARALVGMQTSTFSFYLTQQRAIDGRPLGGAYCDVNVTSPTDHSHEPGQIFETAAKLRYEDDMTPL